MTKRELQERYWMIHALTTSGIDYDDIEPLRRISMTLRRWHELECGDSNGCIERDEATAKTYWLNANSGRRTPTPDRETGAKRRLAAIIGARNARVKPDDRQTRIDPVRSYIQTDPRGAALYILRPGDVPEGSTADCCYSRGICVY